MQYVPGFVWEVLSTGVVSASLVAFVGWLFKRQIGHWLSKDIERLKNKFQKELEAEKASHLQALEAYKVSLIAEAERAKAAQAVKTAVAVKFSEHKFTAVSEIYQAFVGLGMQVLSTYESALNVNGVNDRDRWDRYEETWEVASKRVGVFRDSVQAANVYMLQEEVSELNSVESQMQGILSLGHDLRVIALGLPAFQIKPVQADEFKKLNEMTGRIAFVKNREERVLKILRRSIDRYLSMQPD